MSVYQMLSSRFFAILLLIAARHTMSQVVADSDLTVEQLSQQTTEIVRGLTNAFFGGDNGYTLSSQERRCLAHGSASLAGGMTKICGETVNEIRSVVEPTAAYPSLVPGPLPSVTAVPSVAPFASPAPDQNLMAVFSGAAPPPLAGAPVPPAVPAAPLVPAAPTASSLAEPMEVALVAMEVTSKMSAMFDLEQNLANDCLSGDAQNALVKARGHMLNLTYLEGHVVANGVDIIQELGDAVIAYDTGKMNNFGESMGTAWRKVLLSHRSGDGLDTFVHPSSEAMEEVTEGMLSTLFGPGFTLTVASNPVLPVAAPLPAVPASTPMPGFLASGPGYQVPPIGMAGLPTATASPYANYPGTAQNLAPVAQPAVVQIDLHKCLDDNMILFKSAWEPVWQLVESKLKGSGADGAPVAQPSPEELMMSMFDVQLALKACNIGPIQEEMLLDSLKAGSEFNTSVHVPTTLMDKQELTSMMTEGIQDWQRQEFDSFGEKLGLMLRSMVTAGFEQKYFIDNHGSLRKKIIGASELPVAGFLQHLSPALTTSAGVLCVAFVLFLMALIVTRSRHALSRSTNEYNDVDDSELAVE